MPTAHLFKNCRDNCDYFIDLVFQYRDISFEYSEHISSLCFVERALVARKLHGVLLYHACLSITSRRNFCFFLCTGLNDVLLLGYNGPVNAKSSK